MDDSYFGYKVRKHLFSGEDNYFRRNTHVAGMAAEDGQIIFNPYAPKEVNLHAVGQNEAARLWLRQNSVRPKFDVTPQQQEFFKGTEYEANPLMQRHTILGRIISGDPSVGEITPQQQKWADWTMEHLKKRR